jgi:hypothetical protein
MSDWQKVSWDALERLRQGFLDGGLGLRKDYWRGAVELESYDLTFAQRIGWKWDAVLAEGQARGLQKLPGRPALLDWGCGTGIAARRFLAAYGADAVSGVFLHDRSATAAAFAARRLREEFGADLPVSTGSTPSAPYVLLASHVLSELDTSVAQETLVGLAGGADATWLVEPGTPAQGAVLVGIRERLRDRFAVMAPCPHAVRCGMLAPERAGDWCHNFARPPSEVFRDPNWVAFGKRMSIDLRSLPVSFLVLARKELAQPLSAGQVRMLGRARINKVGASFLGCSASGVAPCQVYKRTASRRVKELGDTTFTALLSPDEVDVG